MKKKRTIYAIMTLALIVSLIGTSYALSPAANTSNNVDVFTFGLTSVRTNALWPRNIYPTIYLKQNIQIADGIGTKEKSYILKID